MGKKKKRRGGKSMTRTAFKLVRLGALAAPAIRRMVEPSPPKDKIHRAMRDYTGFDLDDGSFDIGRMAVGWGPYIGACLATYGIPKLVSIIRRL